MATIIEIENVSKYFKLRNGGFLSRKRKNSYLCALSNINLNIEENEIISILGPNGAGKTTLIKILCTLLIPDSGRVTIAGFDLIDNPIGIKKRIGVITGGGIRSNYWRLTGYENLMFFGKLYGLKTKLAKERALELLELMDLNEKKNVKVESYSTGMRVKLSLARALIADPQILLLDEPTIGLDPSFSVFIRNFIKQELQEKQGKTILITTHYMNEADYLSDRVALINKGKIITTDTPLNLKNRLHYKEKLRISFINSMSAIDNNIFDDLPFTFTLKRNVTEKTFVFEINDIKNELYVILDNIKEKNLLPTSIEMFSPTLEEVFLQRLTNDQ